MNNKFDDCPGIAAGLEELDRFVPDLAATLASSCEDGIGVNTLEGQGLPQRREVIILLERLLEVVFPGFDGEHTYTKNNLQVKLAGHLADIERDLLRQIERSLRSVCRPDGCEDCSLAAKTVASAKALLETLPQIRSIMKDDVAAAYAGDPAASSTAEIVLSYPGIRAITIQRFAHVLYNCQVPLLPRLMTEYAHSQTGIDIHPGAQLGRGVFIDHGTGVVVGETAIIGDNVRIYQGVTLGALSFPKDACGMLVKGLRRHPTIESNVTIYSGATVLGDVVIGANSVIGGNVWITDSLPPGTKVTVAPPEHKIKYSAETRS